MTCVVIASPYAGEIKRNVEYLQLCIKDCVRRQEIPYASHKMLPDICDDSNPTERQFGMNAAYDWIKRADLLAVYQNYGVSAGMKKEIEIAESYGVIVDYRTIPMGPPVPEPKQIVYVHGDQRYIGGPFDLRMQRGPDKIETELDQAKGKHLLLNLAKWLL